MLENWHPNFYVLASLLAVVFGLSIGIGVYLKAPKNPASRPFALLTVSAGLWCLLPTLTSFDLEKEYLLFFARVSYALGALAVPAFFDLASIITGYKKHVSVRLYTALIYIIYIAFICVIFHSSFIVDIVRFAPHFIPVVGPSYHIYPLMYLVCVGGAMVIIIKSLCSPQPHSKMNQLVYFGIATVFLGFAPGVHFVAVYFNYEPFPHDLFIPIYAVIMAYSIVKHKLMDIQIVIRRGLVYSMMIAGVTVLYLLGVLITEKLFQGMFGYQSLAVSAVVAAILALCFHPLRHRLHEFADRSLFKGTPEELADQRDQLLDEVRKSEQMKAVGTLAAGLAHEIKNPLTSIKTFTEYLPQKAHEPEFLNKFQRIVGGEVERIQHSIQELLVFAKPVPPKLQAVDTAELLKETTELLSRDCIDRHVEVIQDLQPGIEVMADPRQIKQVFLNLLLNALHAMEQGGQLVLKSSLQDEKLLITIQDNGIGMTKGELKKIFEPFYSTKTQGTGLGMSVVKRILDDHGAQIDVQSIDGEGTRVYIKFPTAIPIS